MTETAAATLAEREDARAKRLQWRMLFGFVGGLLAGLAAHYGAAGQPWVAELIFYLGKVGDVFLRLLFMLVIPLLVSALIVGVAEMGEMGAL